MNLRKHKLRAYTKRGFRIGKRSESAEASMTDWLHLWKQLPLQKK